MSSSAGPVGPIYARGALAIEPFFEGPEQGLIDSGITNAIGQVENGEKPVSGACQEALKNVKTALAV